MYYSTIDNFVKDLHGLLSEDQNRGYPLIYRGPFNPPARPPDPETASPPAGNGLPGRARGGLHAAGSLGREAHL